jgi:hypothetical protein
MPLPTPPNLEAAHPLTHTTKFMRCDSLPPGCAAREILTENSASQPAAPDLTACSNSTQCCLKTPLVLVTGPLPLEYY